MFVVVRKTWTSSYNGAFYCKNNKHGTPAYSRNGARQEFDNLDDAKTEFDNQKEFLKTQVRNPEFFTELWLEEVVNGRTERQIYYLCFGR